MVSLLSCLLLLVVLVGLIGSINCALMHQLLWLSERTSCQGQECYSV